MKLFPLKGKCWAKPILRDSKSGIYLSFLPYNKELIQACNFKMAWTSQGEEVIVALAWYVAQLSPQKKAELGHTYDKVVNPFLGEWTSLNGITFVNLQKRENVWDNLGLLAMLKKDGGLWP